MRGCGQDGAGGGAIKGTQPALPSSRGTRSRSSSWAWRPQASYQPPASCCSRTSPSPPATPPRPGNADGGYAEEMRGSGAKEPRQAGWARKLAHNQSRPVCGDRTLSLLRTASCEMRCLIDGLRVEQTASTRVTLWVRALVVRAGLPVLRPNTRVRQNQTNFGLVLGLAEGSFSLCLLERWCRVYRFTHSRCDLHGGWRGWCSAAANIMRWEQGRGPGCSLETTQSA